MKKILLAAALLLLPAAAHAATCSNPAGTTGAIVFNTTYSVVQVCNTSGNWIALGGNGNDGSSEIDPKVGAQQAGKWCQSSGTQVVCTSDAPAFSGGLADLTGVTLTTPGNGDVLTYNGSQWVNSPATSGATDRIISGTTQAIAYSNTSLSLVTAGTERVIIGTNGNVGIGQQPVTGVAFASSGTSAFNGNVGIGLTNPLVPLHVSASTASGMIARFVVPGDSTQLSYRNFIASYDDANNNIWYMGDANGALKSVQIAARPTDYPLDFITANAQRMRVAADGQVGINTGFGQPSTTLHVVGSLRVGTETSTTLQTCTTNRTGAIKYESNEFSFCRNGTSWETLASIAGGGTLDRIISGTSNVIAQNGGSITISTAGSQRMIFGDNGRIGINTNTPEFSFDVQSVSRMAGIRAFIVGTTANAQYGGPGLTGANTGVYFPNANLVGLTAGGSSAMLVSPTSPEGVRIGVNGITAPAYTMDVSGTVRATRFIGDGSLLTNLPGGSSDRIISGTTQAIAYSNTSLSLVTAGTERMVIGTNGDIGINTQPLAGTSVYVSGTGSIAHFGSSAFLDQYISVRGGVGLMMGLDTDLPNASGSGLIQSGTSKGLGFAVNNGTFGAVSPSMFIATSGNVGIGTIAPSETLHASINQDARTALRVSNLNTGAGASARMIIEGPNGTLSMGVQSPNYTSNSMLLPNKVLIRTDTGIAGINMGTGGNNPLAFFTSDTPRMTILGTGNVGIGTATPENILDIATNNSIGINDVSSLGKIRIGNGTNGVGMYAPTFIGFPIGSTRHLLAIADISATDDTGTNPVFQLISRVSSTNNVTTRPTFSFRNNNRTDMIILANGNIGISTSTPTEKLEVNGNVKATAFIGDGSQLTGIAGGGIPDRIVSGTAYVQTNSNNTVSISGSTYIGNATGTDTILKLGASPTGNHSSYIDLIGDATYTNYGLRIIRGSTGANTTSTMSHRGTGLFSIATVEAAPLVFTTSSTESMRILANGNVGIGSANPLSPLDISSSAVTKFRLIDSTGVNAGFAVSDGAGAGIDPYMDINLLGGDSDTGHVIRFFRSTNTTGPVNVQFLKGDNTTTAGAVINTNGTGVTYFASQGGNVGIGKGNPATNLDVSGSIQYTGTITDISDRRMKMNIEPLAFASATQKLSQLAAVQFEMKAAPGVKEYGFIAQDVEKVFPLLVTTMKDASQTKALNYMGIIPLLVKSNQELAAENAQLKATQESILKRLEALEKRQ